MGEQRNIQYGVPTQRYDFMWGDDIDYKETIDYTDACFMRSAAVYQPSLATASLCMAMACGGSTRLGNPPDYTRQAQNGKALFTLLGFCASAENVEFDVPPQADSIGCIAAYKLVADGTGRQLPLLALGVRGYNYAHEWAGNFTIGEIGDHDGFTMASKKVIAFLQAYIAGQPALAAYPDIKIWISGYSRGAAAANLAAARLVRDAADGADAAPEQCCLGKKLIRENIYAYTFEAPAGACTENLLDSRYDYSAIYNIVNPDDLVPMVAPSCAGFGFGRYGTDCLLPTKISHQAYAEQRDAMLHFYTADGYPPDEFVPCHWEALHLKPDATAVPAQGVQFDRAVTCLGLHVIITRANMVKKYQKALCNLLAGSQQENEGSGHTRRLWMSALWKACIENGAEFFEQLKTDGTEAPAAQLANLLQNTAQEQGMMAAALQESAAPGDLRAVAELIYLFYRADADILGTLLYNQHEFQCISRTHFAQVELAWMRTMDANRQKTPIAPDSVFSAGEYRILCVCGPAIVTVQQNNKTIIRFGLPDKAEDSKVSHPQNALAFRHGKRGELFVGLPADGTYTVQITTEQKKAGIVYSITEYNPRVPAKTTAGAHEKRCVAFGTIPLAPGETLCGTVPAFSAADTAQGLPEGSDYLYTLCKGTDKISPEVDKRRKDL